MFINKDSEVSEVIWSDTPGCYERHLQRRYDNPLFNSERRIISVEDIKNARDLDNEFQKEFLKIYTLLTTEFGKLNEQTPTNNFVKCLQDVQDTIELGSRIGGSIKHEMSVLEEIETKLTNTLDSKFPHLSDMLKQARSLSDMKRVPFLAQSIDQAEDVVLKIDTPILKEEQTASLLSEDNETIKTIGFISKSFNNFHPDEEDVKKCLDEGVKNGLDVTRAKNLLEAWNGTL